MEDNNTCKQNNWEEQLGRLLDEYGLDAFNNMAGPPEDAIVKSSRDIKISAANLLKKLTEKIDYFANKSDHSQYYIVGDLYEHEEPIEILRYSFKCYIREDEYYRLKIVYEDEDMSLMNVVLYTHSGEIFGGINFSFDFLEELDESRRYYYTERFCGLVDDYVNNFEHNNLVIKDLLSTKQNYIEALAEVDNKITLLSTK